MGIRERLLEAGKALFAEKGFAGTSTREIAAKAGCNIAMIPHYFGSKQGLLRELIRPRMQQVIAEIQGLSQAGGSVRDKVGRWVDFLVEKLAEDPAYTQLFQREVASGNAEFLEDFRPFALASASAFTGMLERAQKQGELRADVDAKIVAVLLMGMVQYYFINYPVASHVIGPATPQRLGKLKKNILAVFERGALRP